MALRLLKQHLLSEAAIDAQSTLRGQDAFRDLQVDVEVHERSSSVHLLPVFVASYEYGTRYKSGTHGVIVPHKHMALIGAGGDIIGRVVATPHVSAIKTGGLAGGLVSALGTTLTLPLSDLSLASASASFSPLVLTETAVAAVIVATAVGSWAKGFAQGRKNDAARKQSEEDKRFYAAYDRLIHRTDGPSGANNQPDSNDAIRQLDEERLLWLWSETDWRRWEAEEPWNWDPKAKMKEAETLWRKVSGRPLERQKERYQRRLAAERAQQEQEEAQMGGPSSRRQQRRFPATGQPSSQGPRDFLGYYKLLGIDQLTLSKGPNAQAELDALIKQRFKSRAMDLHPDRQAGKLMTDEESKIINVQFQKLQIAYETLRDVEKRQAYDQGQLFN